MVILALLNDRQLVIRAMQGCSFKTSKYKQAAGRIHVARELGLVGSYTLETSLAGDGATRTHHTIPDLLQLGTSLCLAVHDLVTADAERLLLDMIRAGALVDHGAEMCKDTSVEDTVGIEQPALAEQADKTSEVGGSHIAI